MESFQRMKEIRKELGLSQDAFGKKLGVTRSAVNKIENGKSKLTEQTIKLICNEFNVDPFWLETGKGDMFTAIPETIIDELVDEFNLDENDKIIIQSYLEATDEQQKVIKEFLLSISDKLKRKSGN